MKDGTVNPRSALSQLPAAGIIYLGRRETVAVDV
jgi:hypothetical protein